ncbi:hypothetical protein PUR61_15610 [Streptomyces sp. BE20]|uniref:hypothetical protein n=1 Tax=Streptomyces sp. BE20 TaxID=3002525 RepID=UPI002E75A6CB|nr:hypothetical protein [Streptomyces sp. BE20]MEE1823608.1 hypothetical protein [Streptomyces sp. BE20]
MTTTRARSACLAAAAALSLLTLASVAPAAHATTLRLKACNEAGSRQPGDALINTGIVAQVVGIGGSFSGSYPGYTITKVEARTVLGTPMCIVITDGGPGTDRVTLTTRETVGSVWIYGIRK